MTTIDRDRAFELLNQAASETPDFIYREWYNACVYVCDTNDDLLLERYRTVERDDNDEPIVPQEYCIVGKVMLLAGANEDELAGISGGVEDVADEFESAFDIYIESDARELLALAQQWQDSWLVSWSEAVKLASCGVECLFAAERNAWDARPEVLDCIGRRVKRA